MKISKQNVSILLATTVLCLGLVLIAPADYVYAQPNPGGPGGPGGHSSSTATSAKGSKNSSLGQSKTKIKKAKATIAKLKTKSEGSVGETVQVDKPGSFVAAAPGVAPTKDKGATQDQITSIQNTKINKNATLPSNIK